MKIGTIPPHWISEQQNLAARAIISPFKPLPCFIAGADIAFSPNGTQAVAVAIVWDRTENRIIEKSISRRDVEYPYIPGFLSFREAPALLDAIAGLKQEWQVICFDGQGMAHPRGCGLATHMGVTLDRPSIGIAKSRLCGEYVEPATPAGSYSPLRLDGKIVGSVLRTRDNVKPVFISVGHRMDLPSARRIAMACCTGYRIPAPTRLADILTRQCRLS